MPTFGAGYISTTQILDGAVTNVKVASTAAIAYSKLAALTSANLLVGNSSNVAVVTAITGDISINNTGVTAIEADKIVNADVNTAAAIAYSKLAALTSANILIGSAGNVATVTAVTGDVTISNAGVTAIGASKVTEAMQVLADNTTNNVSTTAHGYVPKVPNNTTTFLRGDATFATPTAAGDVVKMHSAEGSTTNTTEQELSTKTFAANDFAITDTVIVEVEITGGAFDGLAKLRVFDGTNTFTATVFTTQPNTFPTFAYCRICQGNNATTQLAYNAIDNFTATTGFYRLGATMIANWLSSSTFTISLRGNPSTAGTMYWRWKVYKIKS